MDLNIENIMPVVALRGLVVFPGSTVSFDVIRKRSIRALETAMATNKKVFLVTQKDVQKEDASYIDVYKIGCVAEVKQLMKITNGVSKVMVDVKERSRLDELINGNEYSTGRVEMIEEEEGSELIVNHAFIRAIPQQFEEYVKFSKKSARTELHLLYLLMI